MEPAKISTFSHTKSEIKDSIIATLSREENLTAKAIYNNIRDSLSTSVTYQGVHKSLKQLAEQGILNEKECFVA